MFPLFTAVGLILQWSAALNTVSYLMAQSGGGAIPGKHPGEKSSRNKNPKKQKILEPHVSGPIVSKKSKYYVTNIHLALTRCPLIAAGWLKKPGKNESGFGHPLHLAFDENPGLLSKQWHILAWLVRRDRDHPESNRGMPARPDGNFPWRSFVCLLTPPCDTLTLLGELLANKFTEFANSSNDFIGQRNLFVFSRDETHDPPHPVNYYYRDLDTVLILSKVYSGYTKTDLENNDLILEQFFGNVETGHQILSGFTDEDYSALSD